VSSLAGLVGLYSYTAYSTSKSAVRGLSEALQSELAGSSVNLLVVYPGGVKTNIIKNAPNLADDQREAAHTRFTRAASMSADDAADKILRAVRRGKSRLILGTDAKLIYTVHTLFPQSFPKIIQCIFGHAMFGGEEQR
jgi:short-subunit dehydrogenase